jgi:hypothetical protein
MDYRKIYEEYYGIKIPRGQHIHHMDHDHANNHPHNLEMLSPDEHAKKHGFISNFIMAQSTALERAAVAMKKPEIRKKISDARLGMKFSEAHKRQIGISKMGLIPWNKGLKGVQPGWNKGKRIGPMTKKWKVYFVNGESVQFENLMLWCEQHNYITNTVKYHYYNDSWPYKDIIKIEEVE